MTDDASPENLRKFLESDDSAMVRMGISLAKGAGVEVTVKDLERFLKSDDVETIKTGVILADEAGLVDEALEMLCDPEPFYLVLDHLDPLSPLSIRIKFLTKALDPSNDGDTSNVSEYVRVSAAEALGEIGNEALLKDTAVKYKGRGALYYGTSIWFPSTIDVPYVSGRAFTPLVWAIGDEDEDVREAAKEALKKLGHEVEDDYYEKYFYE